MLKNQKLDENLLRYVKALTTEKDFPLRTDKAVLSIGAMMFIEAWEDSKSSFKSIDYFRNEMERLTKKLFNKNLVDKNSRGF